MNNLNYINKQLFLLSGDPKKKNEELPYQSDRKKHMFEIHLKVYACNTKIIRSTYNLSPHMVLMGYLRGEELATEMYKNVGQHLFKTVSLDTTASILADMVTPNLRPDIWIRSADLELEGYLITPVYLTLLDMQKLVYFHTIDEKAKFCDIVLKCPKFFDFIPYLDKTRIDEEKVYVTTDIRDCGKTKVDEEEEEEIRLEIR